MRMLLLIALLALPAFGQKKPVTLDALNDYRGSTPRGIPGEPVWAPDGKAFQIPRLPFCQVIEPQLRALAEQERLPVGRPDRLSGNATRRAAPVVVERVQRDRLLLPERREREERDKQQHPHRIIGPVVYI